MQLCLFIHICLGMGRLPRGRYRVPSRVRGGGSGAAARGGARPFTCQDERENNLMVSPIIADRPWRDVAQATAPPT